MGASNWDSIDVVSEIVKSAGRPHSKQNPGVNAIASNPAKHEIQLQLVSGMENTSSLKSIIMKNKIKPLIALISSIVLIIWMLYHYSTNA